MTCCKPLHAIKSSSGIKFSAVNAERFSKGLPLVPASFGCENIQLPCGSCIECRLAHSQSWGLRCSHEASLYKNNSFLTLTYEEEPEGRTLVKSHFTDFMKRFRYFFPDIRYYMCGEYGDQCGRPHYHAIIFNFDAPDKEFFKTTRKGYNLYTSVKLDEIWSHGHVFIGDVSYKSAAYVARYCVKKITGPAAKDHYQGRVPEYSTMSRNPGIGKGWYDKYKFDAYPSDFLITDGGRKVKPPKYYDSKYAVDYFDDFELLKLSRKSKMLIDDPDRTALRLRDREECKKAKYKSLDRM